MLFLLPSGDQVFQLDPAHEGVLHNTGDIAGDEVERQASGVGIRKPGHQYRHHDRHGAAHLRTGVIGVGGGGSEQLALVVRGHEHHDRQNG